MRNASRIAIVAALAIVAAALVGWRGSRPASPTAAIHTDGVTVVPATGTRRREDAAPAAPHPAPSPVAPTPATITLGIDEVEKLPDLLAAQPRDAAWAPAAEARLRTTFADLPHLGPSLRIACAATLCEVAGTLPAGLSPAEADAALAAFQGSAMARTRADFADNAVRIDQPNDGPIRFTAWLVRR